MIYLDLFIGFLKVGLFSFGGAYGAIPLIRDVVLSYGWLDEEVLTYMIAVSESTPGPIMVNLATYIGSSQAGLLGAALATLAVVLPAFFIILLVMVILKNLVKNAYVQAVLSGLKPCIAGIVLSTGVYMVFSNCFFLAQRLKAEGGKALADGQEKAAGGWNIGRNIAETIQKVVENNWRDAVNSRGITVTCLSALVLFGYRFLRKKKLSPIALIGISACFGVLIFGL